MIRTPFRRFSLWMLLGLGVVMGEDVFAQAPRYRPPSRALPGAVLDNRESTAEFETPPAEEVPRLDFDTPIESPVVSASEEVFHEVHEFPELNNLCYERVICDPVWEVPNMFGDFFGTGTVPLTIRGNQLLNAMPGDVLDPDALGTGRINSFRVLGPAGKVVGRQKAANNNSPLPRNRFFVDYGYIANGILQDGGVSIHRFTPGLERTFLDEMISLEVRVPMAITFDSDAILGGGASRDQGELGDVYLALKTVLWSSMKSRFPPASDRVCPPRRISGS